MISSFYSHMLFFEQEKATMINEKKYWNEEMETLSPEMFFRIQEERLIPGKGTGFPAPSPQIRT